MAALTINNQVPALYSEEKEARYLKVIDRYREEDRKRFGEMLGILMLAVEAEKSSGRYVDILGPVFHDLELHNKWTGQFFTPVNICDMMAEMTWDDSLHNLIRKDGYITVSEPACGSGALVLSFATTMARRGHWKQRKKRPHGESRLKMPEGISEKKQNRYLAPKIPAPNRQGKSGRK